MLNAIGLQNVGMEAFIEKKLPFIRTVKNTPCVVNFFGESLEEYGEVAARLDALPEVAAMEMNISCPNVKHGGIVFGTDPASAASVVKVARAATKKPLIVKLSPNVTDIVAMAHACADAGADALSLINTLIGMAIDLERRRPVLANTTGGLSGPAVKPVALRMVWQVAKAVKVPVIGIGGITNGRDVLEYILVGAAAVQIAELSKSSQALVDGEGKRTLANLADAAGEAQVAAKDIRTMVGRLDGPANEFATNGLPQLTSAIQSLQQTADSLDRLIRDIEANPRGLVGKSPAQEVKVKP